jgi:hypothetical protein
VIVGDQIFDGVDGEGVAAWESGGDVFVEVEGFCGDGVNEVLVDYRVGTVHI